MTLSAHIQTHQAQIEATLKELLAPKHPKKLWEAMAYSTLNGGKRIRPLLTLLTLEGLLGEASPKALPVACALELIHTYSLIHDDLPALDNDDWRRGQPTCHKQYGEALAILAGDALLTHAFQWVSEADFAPSRTVNMLQELSRAAGPQGMCGGQVLDMMYAHETLNKIQEMYALKTGELIRVSVRMGAIMGGANDEQFKYLTDYAEQIGMAFQIVDGILDLTGSLETLGKTPQKDHLQEKETIARIAGLAEAKQMAQTCLDQALQDLEQAKLTQTQYLEEIALYLGQRSS